jgi:ribosomal protein S30
MAEPKEKENEVPRISNTYLQEELMIERNLRI